MSEEIKSKSATSDEVPDATPKRDRKLCPECGSGPDKHELRNYDMIWHDGDVYCTDCGAHVRTWDAG